MSKKKHNRRSGQPKRRSTDQGSDEKVPRNDAGDDYDSLLGDFEPPDLSDSLFDEEEEKHRREREEEERLDAMMEERLKPPPQWRRRPLALIPDEKRSPIDCRYDSFDTGVTYDILKAEHADAEIRPVWPRVDLRLSAVARAHRKDLDSVLGTASDKIGPSKWARTFNVDLARTCLKRRTGGRTIATPVCADRCYVAALAEEYKAFLPRAARNCDLSRRRDFVDLICAAIVKHRTRLVRIHSVGDYYSPPYILKWAEIAKQNPWTEFLSYTRAWRIRELVSALRKLAALPNVSLWLSADRMSGAPPLIGDTRVCFFADTDADGPECLSKSARRRVKLVFRGSARRARVPMTNINGVKVCPHQNGLPSTQTCVSCAFCLFKTHGK